MKRRIAVIAFLFLLSGLAAQEVHPLLERLKTRLDSVARFEARVRMEVDVSFVNMPVKYADIRYERGKPLTITSEDFTMIPKRGLDLALGELYEFPFMTLSLGQVVLEGRACEVIKVIPTTDQSDYSIATLWLDPQTLQLLKSQLHTTKNGVYDITYRYRGEGDVLPGEIRVGFEVSGIRIPLRFLGKDTQVDREKLKAGQQQQGAIYLQFDQWEITRR
jgi:hypothetical protein